MPAGTKKSTTTNRCIAGLTTVVVSIGTVMVLGPGTVMAAPCDAPVVNPIACENSLPGNPESQWGVSGSGSSSIQGFATDISVDQGNTIGFKIDTTASSYRLDIYRMGYYGGSGARFAAAVDPTSVTKQPNCLSDGATGLIDCGNWSQSASWTVPATAVSGIYFAKLVRTDGQAGNSHIMFVVRDDDGGSDLLFQTSDTTWQAYNAYGGNSLYTGSPAGRAYKVSYNRPFTTRDNAPEDWVFNAEYPMVRFLESNGFNVSYSTGVDTDRRGAELLKHKVFLSTGHDEYWSGGQRANVEAARDAGVQLAFFSGNEVYWKTRWENSIDGSGTPSRTLVSYKETAANAIIDPATPIWTGTWRDKRFSPPTDGGRPENGLTGTIFSVNCCAVNMTVGAADGAMRFWRNTRVAALAGSQTTTIGTNVIGYEWDEDLDNGSRPAGLIRVSETFAANQQILLDNGSTFGTGPATHAMTLYRASSGALVFGAGTVQWAWALDSSHDRGSSPADVAAQQATVNLFADMGVQPSTLGAGLVSASKSTDSTRATATITSPTHGSSVAPGSNVVVTGAATDVGGKVGGVEVSTDGGTTWRRATGRGTWTYSFTAPSGGTISILARATDDSANIGTPTAPVTIDANGTVTCPCSIWSPPDVPLQTDSDTGSIEVGVKFRAAANGFVTGVRFYKYSSNTGTHVGSLWSSAGVNLGSVTFTNESGSGWQQATFASPIAVTANTTYVVSYFAPNGRYGVTPGYFNGNTVVSGPLTALANGTDGGNGVYRYGSTPAQFPNSVYQGENYWVDVVYNTSATDTTAPSVTARVPGVNATGIALGTTVSATFSEPVNGAGVQVQVTGSSAVAGATSYDSGSRTVTFTPTQALEPNTVHTVNLAGVADLAGNAMAPTSWSFTTTGPPPPLPADGPGGPIGVVTSATDGFSAYFGEIFRAEGLNAFETFDVTLLNATKLAGYTTVVLGPVTLTTTQVNQLTTWVTNGGNLIASRPDSKLAPLLGLTAAGGTLSDGYILVNTASAPGTGIVGATMQFHGTADRYTLNGATSVATLYSSATAPTTNPAVTMRSVGSNGGQVAAFTYDLARSVVYTRQGNPAWAAQERDNTGDGIIRSDDLYFGGAQTDWVDLNKVAIPQADEQQQLLANLIEVVNGDIFPLPRFWYFPKEHQAVVIATGDDHANGGTATRFETYLAADTPGCSRVNWECNRFTSYVYPGSPLSNSAASTYQTMGFEVALHPQNGCRNFSSTQDLRTTYTSELASFAQRYPSVTKPVTSRFHCLAWSDWDSQATVEGENGIRLDVNYYYWPGSWIQNRPGFMTGSGMPQRFARTNGSMIDVFQAATQMTDESGQTYPFTSDTLLDRALGSTGYYGYFVANMHTDFGNTQPDTALLNSARTRGVPVVAARDVLEFVDGRNASSFRNLAWGSNALTFDISVGTGATNLTSILPTAGPGGTTLTGLTRVGNAVTYNVKTIKGISYAIFPAAAGSYSASYGVVVDTTPPTVSYRVPGVGATGVSTGSVVSATFSEPVTGSVVQVTAGSVVAGSSSYDAATRTLTFTPAVALAAGTTYTVNVSGATDGAGNVMLPVSWTFTTAVPPACPCSIWSSATVPPTESASDSASVELGVKFRAAESGYVSGIRFYKGLANTGTHVGNLWSSTGTNLGSVTFSGESASGWQQALFASPIAVTAGTTYVASYHAPNGGYALAGGGLAADVVNGPLTALASGASGGNGVYLYGAGGFPTGSFVASNYFVDVVFTTSAAPPADTTPPTVSSRVPGVGATGVSTGSVVSATFSEPVTGSVVQVTAGSVVAGSSSYDAATRTLTFTPAVALAAGTTYTVNVSGATDGAGNVMLPVSWTFTTAVPPPAATLYFSTLGNTNPPGVTGTADDADVYSWNGTSFARVWVASAVSVPAVANLDGYGRVDATTFYASFSTDVALPGLGIVQDEDVVLFNGTSWSLYFDGTARGLTSDAHDIDAISIVGSVLYFSTAGNANPPGVSGTADDADIYRWNGTSFARVWDATVNGLLTGANVDGLVWTDPTHFYLSFRSTATTVPGLGSVADVSVVYNNVGTWSTYFSGTANGLAAGSNLDLDAFSIA